MSKRYGEHLSEFGDLGAAATGHSFEQHGIQTRNDRQMILMIHLIRSIFVNIEDDEDDDEQRCGW